MVYLHPLWLMYYDPYLDSSLTYYYVRKISYFFMQLSHWQQLLFLPAHRATNTMPVLPVSPVAAQVFATTESIKVPVFNADISRLFDCALLKDFVLRV